MSAQARSLRTLLQHAQEDEEGAELFQALYQCWCGPAVPAFIELCKAPCQRAAALSSHVRGPAGRCHSAGALLSLCFLAGAYEHAFALIQAFCELPMGVEVLVQVRGSTRQPADSLSKRRSAAAENLKPDTRVPRPEQQDQAVPTCSSAGVGNSRHTWCKQPTAALG